MPDFPWNPADPPPNWPADQLLEPYSPENLPEIAGGWKLQTYSVAGHSFELFQPAIPDALLDDPEVLEAHARDGYMPYWGYLWPTALEMSKALLAAKLPAGIPVLEIGAGLGLAGIAACAAGLRVTISDYDRSSVRVALLNAQRNGFSEVEGVGLDWRDPPDLKFPLILGCDVIYERANHAPILGLCEKMLPVNGECWLADPGRHQADEFVNLTREQGFELERRPIVREPFPTRPDGMTDIWVVRKIS